MSDTKIRIVTHSAGFHADDVFGVATLLILLGEENCEVIRSREQSVIDTGDYVLDVGFVYDAEKNRFDHHQEGGAGVRENGVPYASFGLIWKKFGRDICGSQEIADTVEKALIVPIDLFDNGGFEEVPGKRGYLVQDVVGAYERMSRDEQKKLHDFLDAARFARGVITREIEHAQEVVDMNRRVDDAYQAAEDKRLVVISDEEGAYERWLVVSFLSSYPEPLYCVFKNSENNWTIAAVVKHDRTFEVRKDLPISWAGKREQELADITGVPDAFFCHNKLFIAVAKSKEGALKLAELALKG